MDMIGDVGVLFAPNLDINQAKIIAYHPDASLCSTRRGGYPQSPTLKVENARDTAK
jgi:hypothetical protein